MKYTKDVLTGQWQSGKLFKVSIKRLEIRFCTFVELYYVWLYNPWSALVSRCLKKIKKSLGDKQWITKD